MFCYRPLGLLAMILLSSFSSAFISRRMSRLRPERCVSLRAKTKSGKSKQKPADIISVEDVYSDMWKVNRAIDILREGGVGVICTDTCYSFVSLITSSDGAKRISDLKGTTGQKKPLSILCKDLTMISQYTADVCDQKWAFKLLKATLPGPYTLILPSSKLIPKMVVDHHHHHVKRFKRKEIGVRIPDDPICSFILDNLDAPLLSGSVPEANEDSVNIVFPTVDDIESENSVDELVDDGPHVYQGGSDGYMFDLTTAPWASKVDFIIENGPRGEEGKESLSTIVDLTSGTPIVIRTGKGDFDFSSAE